MLCSSFYFRNEDIIPRFGNENQCTHRKHLFLSCQPRTDFGRVWIGPFKGERSVLLGFHGIDAATRPPHIRHVKSFCFISLRMLYFRCACRGRSSFRLSIFDRPSPHGERKRNQKQEPHKGKNFVWKTACVKRRARTTLERFHQSDPVSAHPAPISCQPLEDTSIRAEDPHLEPFEIHIGDVAGGYLRALDTTPPPLRLLNDERPVRNSDAFMRRERKGDACHMTGIASHPCGH